MTECLERAVLDKQIPLLDKLQVIKILSDGQSISGLLCYDVTARGGQRPLCADPLQEHHLCHRRPCRHVCGQRLPLQPVRRHRSGAGSGARGKNLTEWQYGLASVKPRWNVSGTYMQVLPRVFSTAADGSDEREFLMNFFRTPGRDAGQAVPERLPVAL